MKKRFLVRTMVLAVALSMSAFVACGKIDTVDESNMVTNEEQADDGNQATNEEQVEVSVAGTYVYSYTEEYDGEEIEVTNIIVLKDDNTCEVTFQDTIAGKWGGSKITLDDGSEFEYKIEDGNLVLNQAGVWNTYTKGDSNANSTVESEDVENPGLFDTDLWSISYDTEMWYGFEDNGSVIINNLNAVAGSSYIEIKEFDVATAAEAITMIQDEYGKKLTTPEKAEVSGNECYVAYDEPTDSKEEGVSIFDFYLIFEHNGKVIIINESITEDPDESRAEALSYKFDDVINTFVLK